jgi:hypothetical protein
LVFSTCMSFVLKNLFLLCDMHRQGYSLHGLSHACAAYKQTVNTDGNKWRLMIMNRFNSWLKENNQAENQLHLRNAFTFLSDDWLCWVILPSACVCSSIHLSFILNHFYGLFSAVDEDIQLAPMS